MMKKLKLLGIVIVAVVGGIAAIIGLGFLWLATARSVPVTDADKRTVVRAVDLEPFFDEYAPAEEHELFAKVRFIDQSEELSYEYDSPDEEEPYIAVTVTHERNKGDANATYAIEWSAQQVGFNLADGDFDLEENNAFYSGGDRSRFADITYDGESVGHLFVAQKGNSVYAFTITGFVLDDPAIWQDLFDDRLAGFAGN